MSAYLSSIDWFSRFFYSEEIPIHLNFTSLPGDKVKSGEFDSTVGDRTAVLVGWDLLGRHCMKRNRRIEIDARNKSIELTPQTFCCPNLINPVVSPTSAVFLESLLLCEGLSTFFFEGLSWQD